MGNCYVEKGGKGTKMLFPKRKALKIRNQSEDVYKGFRLIMSTFS
jgi:hypothetical protein